MADFVSGWQLDALLAPVDYPAGPVGHHVRRECADSPGAALPYRQHGRDCLLKPWVQVCVDKQAVAQLAPESFLPAEYSGYWEAGIPARCPPDRALPADHQQTAAAALHCVG